MHQARRILVVGATGKQGGAVARHLLDSGFKVRALTRDAASNRAAGLRNQGAEIAIGDLDDRASLERAMEGIEGVFSVQNYWEPRVGFTGEIGQAKNLAAVAKQGGIKHYVQSTMADAMDFRGVEHFESKAVIERYIDQIELPRTFIGTVYFMDNLLDPRMGGPMTFPALAGGLKSETPLHMIAVDDIGAIVAAVFRDGQRFIGQKLNVAGDVLTVPEMKAVYRQVMGVRPRPYRIPRWVLRVMNKEFARQLQWHNDAGWTLTPQDAHEVHPGIMSFEQFLRRYRPQGL